MNNVYYSRVRRLNGFPITGLILSGLLFFTSTSFAQLATSGYRLIGTIKAGGFTGAVIADSAGAQNFYRLKELLPDGSELTAVASDSIIVRASDGGSYEMYIAHDNKVGAQGAPAPASDIGPGPESGSVQNPESPRARIKEKQRKRHSRTE